MNIRKTILIAMVFCADLTWACQAKLIRSTAKEKRAKALELLDKYAETLNKQQSYICKWKIIANMNAKLSEPPYNALSGKSRKIQLIECRYDDNRYAERIHKWGNIRSSKIFIPKDRGPYNSILWDGRMYFSYVATVDTPGRLGIYRSIEDLSNKNTRNNHKINSRFGPCSGLVNVYDLNLRKIQNLSVREKTEKIKGIDCYVIEAVDKNAKYILWIDPEHGYNTSQWQLEYSNMNLHVSLENVRFQRIDNVWIIVRGILKRREYFRNGDFTSETKHCELTEMILNPDHYALDSFRPDDVLDGAIVLFHGKSYDHIIAATGGLSRKGRGEVVDEQGRVVSYTWYNGKFMDSAGKLFSLDEVCAIPTLLDKLLPDLKDFNVDLSLEEVKYKIMLVCFWNMNHRPSRNCMKQLSLKVKELEQREVMVVAVHASKIEHEKLYRWITKNKITFPAGIIAGQEKQIRFNWSIKSLPWLILVDKQHIVTAEGFGIDELDAKIEKLKPATNAPADTNKVTGLTEDSQGQPLSGVQVTEFHTDKNYTTDDCGEFVSAFGLSNERRVFFAVDKQRKLVGVGILQPGEKHVEITLTPGKMVSGIVVDSAGKPVPGAQVAPQPMTCYHVLTDEQGRFDLGWSPEWAGDLKEFFLMARHLGRNLAGGIEIDGDSKKVRIELEPALMLTGAVEDPNGAPIPGAEVGLSLRRSRWACGTPVRKVITDEKGGYTFAVLPQRQEYINYAEAEGFWRNQITTGIINRTTDCEQVGPIILKRPNLSVSGMVLNANGRLVADIPVHLKGEGQPYLDTKTDTNGKFIFKKVCSGPVQISAKTDALFGKIETEGGAKNVKLVVRPRFE